MCEIRFEVFDKHNHNECVYDIELKEYWSLGSVVELLNQLNDENHLLRVKLDTHKHPLWSTRESERIVNELKQENTRLKHQLDSLSGLWVTDQEVDEQDKNKYHMWRLE